MQGQVDGGLGECRAKWMERLVSAGPSRWRAWWVQGQVDRGLGECRAKWMESLLSPGPSGWRAW